MAWLLVALVPFALVAGYPGHTAESERAFIVAAAAYGALLFAYSLRLAFTDCPRCQAFYHFSWWSNPWTQRCLHCGLKLRS